MRGGAGPPPLSRPPAGLSGDRHPGTARKKESGRHLFPQVTAGDKPVGVIRLMFNRNSKQDPRTASDDREQTRRMERARGFWGQQERRENEARGKK